MDTTIKTTRRLTETALMIALATVLFALPVFKMPMGGEVTLFGQLTIVVISYRYGVKWGLLSGFTLSIIQFLFGLGNLAYVTGIKGYLILIFADYLFAFSGFGLGGIFRKAIKNQAVSLAAGGALVSVIRFICHFVSGVTIWGGYAPEGTPVWKYSLFYNGSFMLAELALTVVGALILGSVIDLTKPDLKRGKKIEV